MSRGGGSRLVGPEKQRLGEKTTGLGDCRIFGDLVAGSYSRSWFERNMIQGHTLPVGTKPMGTC